MKDYFPLIIWQGIDLVMKSSRSNIWSSAKRISGYFFFIFSLNNRNISTVAPLLIIRIWLSIKSDPSLCLFGSDGLHKRVIRNFQILVIIATENGTFTF